MLRVDCRDLSNDEKAALAGEISDELDGRAIALIKLNSIVFDRLDGSEVTPESILAAVSRFISERTGSVGYSYQLEGDVITVHATIPAHADKQIDRSQLPPNLMQCPYCSFITQYQEEYNVHLRAHLVGV
jgi:hypothetical protein